MTKKKGSCLSFLFKVGLVGILVMTIIGGLTFFYYNDFLSQDEIVVSSQIPDDKKIEISIPTGANSSTIAGILVESGAIQYEKLFKILSRFSGYDGSYRAGIHYISKDYNYNQIMKAISNEPVGVFITIPEGYNFNQISSKFEEKGFVNKKTFKEEANKINYSYDFIKDIPKREPRLEGYLFPDTYKIDTVISERDIIQQMLNNFNNKFKPEYYERLKELDMTLDEIIILASIIEREARLEEERKIISGVFHNRLNSSDVTLNKLQSCATIQYIYYQREGIMKENILVSDTEISDPYNTYINAGLPPGPIGSPGISSILAALYPEKHDYYYFVYKGDGSHEFSTNHNDHINAMNKYEGVN